MLKVPTDFKLTENSLIRQQVELIATFEAKYLEERRKNEALQLEIEELKRKVAAICDK